MDPSDAIAALVEHRGLATRADVAAFDAALVALAGRREPELLDAIHLVLVDDTEDQQVMFGVVHLIEAAGLDRQLASMFRVLPALAEQAPEWVMTLHYRLLADPISRRRYPEIADDATGEAVGAARAILEVVAEDPDAGLAAGARAVLDAMPEPLA